MALEEREHGEWLREEGGRLRSEAEVVVLRCFVVLLVLVVSPLLLSRTRASSRSLALSLAPTSIPSRRCVFGGGGCCCCLLLLLRRLFCGLVALQRSLLAPLALSMADTDNDKDHVAAAATSSDAADGGEKKHRSKKHKDGDAADGGEKKKHRSKKDKDGASTGDAEGGEKKKKHRSKKDKDGTSTGDAEGGEKKKKHRKKDKDGADAEGGEKKKKHRSKKSSSSSGSSSSKKDKKDDDSMSEPEEGDERPIEEKYDVGRELGRYDTRRRDGALGRSLHARSLTRSLAPLIPGFRSRSGSPSSLNHDASCCSLSLTPTSSGAFSVVKECTSKRSGRKYAVKIIEKQNAGQDIARLRTEMEILKSVKHPNIIALKEIVEDDKTLYIITELYVFAAVTRARQRDCAR